MEPHRGILIEQVVVGGRALPPGTPVWIHAERPHGEFDVEFQNHFERIPARSVAASPIPRPSIDELRAKDPCFGLGDDAFEEVFREDQLFAFHRCRAHGRLFLEDLRGGIAMYNRWILVTEGHESDLRTLWSRYHAISDDVLNFRCIAL